MDHLLLGDEVCGFVDEGHERVEFVGPVVQQVIGVFGPLEVDDACQPVHFGVNGLVHHQVGEELLRLLQREEQERTGEEKSECVVYAFIYLDTFLPWESLQEKRKITALCLPFTKH